MESKHSADNEWGRWDWKKSSEEGITSQAFEVQSRYCFLPLGSAIYKIRLESHKNKHAETFSESTSASSQEQEWRGYIKQEIMGTEYRMRKENQIASNYEVLLQTSKKIQAAASFTWTDSLDMKWKVCMYSWSFKIKIVWRTAGFLYLSHFQNKCTHFTSKKMCFFLQFPAL